MSQQPPGYYPQPGQPQQGGYPQQAQQGYAQPGHAPSQVRAPEGYVPQPSGFKTAGGQSQRWDAGVSWYDPPENEFARLRFIGPVSAVYQHWLKSKNQKNFAMFCRNWDFANQGWHEEGHQDCPICKDFGDVKEMGARANYLTHAIVRALNTVKPMRLNGTVRISLDRLSQVNVHTFEGRQMAVDITDPYYGMDVFYYYAPRDNSNKHQVSQAGPTPLTEQEMQFLHYLTDWKTLIRYEPCAEVVRSLKINGYYGQESHAPAAAFGAPQPDFRGQVMAAVPPPPTQMAQAPAPYAPTPAGFYAPAPAPFAPPPAPSYGQPAHPAPAPQTNYATAPLPMPSSPRAEEFNMDNIFGPGPGPGAAAQPVPSWPQAPQAHYQPQAPAPIPGHYGQQAPQAPQPYQGLQQGEPLLGKYESSAAGPGPVLGTAVPAPRPEPVLSAPAPVPPVTAAQPMMPPMMAAPAPSPLAPSAPNQVVPLARPPVSAPPAPVPQSAESGKSFSLMGKGLVDEAGFNQIIPAHAVFDRAVPLKQAGVGELLGMTVHKCFGTYAGDSNCIRCPIRRYCLEAK